MKKIIILSCLLISVFGYSQSYNGLYTNNEIYGMKLTITNYNKENGTFNFEFNFNKNTPCINSGGKFRAKLVDDRTDVFVYIDTYDDYRGQKLYFFFNSDGTLTLNSNNSGEWTYIICDGLNKYPIKLSKSKK